MSGTKICPMRHTMLLYSQLQQLHNPEHALRRKSQRMITPQWWWIFLWPGGGGASAWEIRIALRMAAYRGHSRLVLGILPCVYGGGVFGGVVRKYWFCSWRAKGDLEIWNRELWCVLEEVEWNSGLKINAGIIFTSNMCHEAMNQEATSRYIVRIVLFSTYAQSS